VKIKLVDGTVKTIMLDMVQPVSQLTQFIAEKLGIKLTDEFGLQKDENKGYYCCLLFFLFSFFFFFKISFLFLSFK